MYTHTQRRKSVGSALDPIPQMRRATSHCTTLPAHRPSSTQLHHNTHKLKLIPPPHPTSIRLRSHGPATHPAPEQHDCGDSCSIPSCSSTKSTPSFSRISYLTVGVCRMTSSLRFLPKREFPSYFGQAGGTPCSAYLSSHATPQPSSKSFNSARLPISKSKHYITMSSF